MCAGPEAVRRDTAHILKLLMEVQFPPLSTQMPRCADLRQLLILVHRLVQDSWRVKNGSEHLAMNRVILEKNEYGVKPTAAFLAFPLPVRRAVDGKICSRCSPSSTANPARWRRRWRKRRLPTSRRGC